MIDLSDYILLGTISKTHGIRGQVVLRLNHLSFDSIKKMESVMIEIDGLPVPFFIENFAQKTSDVLILSFEDLHSEESVKELTGCRSFISKHDIRVTLKPETLHQLSLLTGYTVIDKDSGKLGKLAEIIDIESNPLLRILNKEKEILLPFQQEFLTGIDTGKKVLYVSAPAGLIDLY